MFSMYIVWYLFLAGAGSGAYALASVLGFIGQITGKRSVQEYGRIADGGFYLGPILVFVGTVFLLFDLGSPQKAWLVVVNFRPAILTFGVWFILLFLLVSTVLTAQKLAWQFRLPRLVLIVLQGLALLLALALMAYTGVFLASVPAVPFHNTWLLVALFVCSSLATGSAVITLYGFLNQHRKAMRYSLKLIPRTDIFLIALEALILIAYFWAAYSDTDFTRLSVNLLLIGDCAPIFWISTITCGLVIPLGIALHEGSRPRPTALAISALSVLIGGLALRWCIIEAGLHISQM